MMTLYRTILRSLRRSSSLSTTTTTQTLALHHQFQPVRSFAFSSASKRRLRIQPALHALRRGPNAPSPKPDPNALRLPESTSALVGPRLNLHNRVHSLIRAGDLDAASALCCRSVASNAPPTVFTCNAIMAAMYRAKRYDDAIDLFHFFYRQCDIVPNIVSYNILINTHCDAGRVGVGLEMYLEIIADAPFRPSPVTYRHLTKGLIDAGRIGEAVLLREMLSKGHGADNVVYNNLIAGFLNPENKRYIDNPIVHKAPLFKLIDEVKERCLVQDGVVNAAFMDWFSNRGGEKEAMESLIDGQFRMIPGTCNVLLEVLLKHGKVLESAQILKKMGDGDLKPDAVSYDIVIRELCKEGNLDMSLELLGQMVSHCVGLTPEMREFVLEAFGKEGRGEEIERLLH